MKKNIFLLLLGFFLLLTSCKTKDKASDLNYMQNAENIATDAAIKTAVNTIQPGDQLNIYVTAKNMEVVKPFNQTYYSSQNPAGAVTSTTNQASEKPYFVKADGNFEFPILGTVNTTDKSVEELQSELTDRISYYVKDPGVVVRLVNFKVTVLGEVNRPGQYPLPEINPTLLNALGYAGDLTTYAKRTDILIVRNVDGQLSKERINLMDASFINSPYYFLKQGDVIYVSSNETKEKISRQDPNTGIYIAVASTIIGLAGIFITIFKN